MEKKKKQNPTRERNKKPLTKEKTIFTKTVFLNVYVQVTVVVFCFTAD